MMRSNSLMPRFASPLVNRFSTVSRSRSLIVAEHFADGPIRSSPSSNSSTIRQAGRESQFEAVTAGDPGKKLSNVQTCKRCRCA